MQSMFDLQSAERRAYQHKFRDGLWDVLLGCFALLFALAPILSESLGDFWSSAIFLPFWALVYLGIVIIRRKIIQPRMGTFTVSAARGARLRRFTLLMVGLNILALTLGIIQFFQPADYLGATQSPFGSVYSIMGIFFLLAFSIAGWLLNYPRFYLYGVLLLIALPAGEWLYQHAGAGHHGFPIAFGLVSLVMIVMGLVSFFRLIKEFPPVQIPVEGE